MSRALLFLQHFPGGAAPGRATGGGAACGIPGGVVPGRATGWWCGLWDSRRRCAWTGYSLVVRPAGFPAALRLAGLLAGGASCGMSSPGEAFMPTPGKFTGARCEKSPYLRTSSHLEYGGEGGIDSLRSPLRGSPLTAFADCPTGCASCRTPVGGSHPPPTENIKEKSPYFRTSSHLEYGGEGGIRTPDTLPYTHFPGVLLQPLGHLTILSCCSPWVGNGALL